MNDHFRLYDSAVDCTGNTVIPRIHGPYNKNNLSYNLFIVIQNGSEGPMSEFLTSYHAWIKAAHVISVISWMAGMMYLPRLFVYHTEERQRLGDNVVIFETMEEKLLRVIMNPAMIATWVFGLLLIGTPGVVDFGSFWIWIKLACVIAMSGYHGWLSRCRKELQIGTSTITGRQFRMLNEVPAVLMVVIVIMVIVQPF